MILKLIDRIPPWVTFWLFIFGVLFILLMAGIAGNKKEVYDKLFKTKSMY